LPLIFDYVAFPPTIVAEPNHFYAAPGKNFDAAPASTILYSKPPFFFFKEKEIT
jgi:hypothetical protein